MSIARYRFVILLVALALFLFVTPVAREMASTPESIGSHLVATSFFVALLLTAVFAASRTRFAAMVAMALTVQCERGDPTRHGRHCGSRSRHYLFVVHRVRHSPVPLPSRSCYI